MLFVNLTNIGFQIFENLDPNSGKEAAIKRDRTRNLKIPKTAH